jgi:lipoate-protein ligase A
MTDSDVEYDQTEQRLSHLETKQDQTDGKLDELIDMVRRFTGGRPVTHGQAERDTEDRLDRPSSVAEQVRAELAKARADADAEAAASADKSDRESMRERLARLEEKAPLPPQPRRQRVMWGNR